MEEILDILKELHPDVDFTVEENLIGDKLLDSLDIVSLISEIDAQLDVATPAEEIIPENFASARAIYELVTRLDEA